MLNKSKIVINDGFRPDLVEKAIFEGIMEIPKIKPPEEYIIPKDTIPFSQRKRSKNHSEFIVFYEDDLNFLNLILAIEQNLDALRMFPGVISTDNSLYRNMPFAIQIANIYMNRAIAHYLQSNGIYVIPNVRWGDERSYTTCILPEKVAFVGLPKHSMVSVGTYGCIKSKENKYYFREGLRAMLDELEPEIVLVYGAMPKSVFYEFENRTQFIQYNDWISKKKGVK